MRTPFSRRGRRTLLPLLLAGLALVLLPGCGGGCDDCVYVIPSSGNVYVDNLTDLDVPKFVFGFYMAPVGGTWTGNLLLASLPPASTQFVGTFTEDVYDAEADLELGDLVTWFDIPVPAGDETFFEVY